MRNHGRRLRGLPRVKRRFEWVQQMLFKNTIWHADFISIRFPGPQTAIVSITGTGGPSPTLLPSISHPFEHSNCLIEPCAFLTQLGQHLRNVHSLHDTCL